jgi:hypothetical protein
MKKNTVLTEKEYLTLCIYCDSILKERELSLTCHSIPSLHIIREHPLFLRKYSLFFKNNLSDRINLLVNLTYGWLCILSKSFFSRDILYSTTIDKGRKSELDFLFISHLLNEGYGDRSNDFYYDSVPYFMQQNGYNSAIGLINHTKNDKPSFFKNLNQRSIGFFLFSRNLSFISEISFFFKIVKEAIELLKIRRKTVAPFLKKVILSAIFDSFSKTAVNSLRIHRQVQHLVKEYNPKFVVVTYEGHAWERLAFAAARSSNSSVKCIGYQHSAVFRLQHAIRRSLAQRFNPDIIFCSGVVGKSKLDIAVGLKSIPKFVLGSNRSIDNFPIKNTKEFMNAKLDSCLVMPEDDISECNILFEFSIECAKELPNVKFIWRLHPLVTFSSLTKLNKKLRKLPSNVFLSNDTLADDIAKCNIALYRGTTAIVQAVGNGLKPIYLALHDEMTIDPLYEINPTANYVYQPADFKKRLDQSVAPEQALRIREYCVKMFQPISSEILLQQITKQNA